MIVPPTRARALLLFALVSTGTLAAPASAQAPDVPEILHGLCNPSDCGPDTCPADLKPACVPTACTLTHGQQTEPVLESAGAEDCRQFLCDDVARTLAHGPDLNGVPLALDALRGMLHQARKDLPAFQARCSLLPGVHPPGCPAIVSTPAGAVLFYVYVGSIYSDTAIKQCGGVVTPLGGATGTHVYEETTQQASLDGTCRARLMVQAAVAGPFSSWYGDHHC